MRLDKFLSLCGKASRSETLRSVRRGEITVNGVPARRGDCPVEPDTDTVVFRGETVVYRPYTYVMLHKPDGVVSATEDRLAGEPTVLDLLPPELTRLRPGLFPCGRLDKHTTGLMLLTNNGKLAHRLLSPARHVDKTYAFTVKFPLSAEDVAALESGVSLRNADGGTDCVTAPCRVELTDCTGRGAAGRITLHEGKYHQIKRMFGVYDAGVNTLHRLSIGGVALDETLAPGEYRELTEEERKQLQN